VGAAVYASVRLIEAYGLFFERSWAEILAGSAEHLRAVRDVRACPQTYLVRPPHFFSLTSLSLQSWFVLSFSVARWLTMRPNISLTRTRTERARRGRPPVNSTLGVTENT